MTRIEYAIVGEEMSLVCQGHAGYAEAGNDIVCAGISTLVQTLVSHLEKITKNVKYSIAPGALWIWAHGYEARNSFETIITGLKLLESSYPQYISIDKGCPIVSENPLQ